MGKKAKEAVEDVLEKKKILYSAAILHDIGHGPFSHALEATTTIAHESLTTNIIRGNTDINAILSASGIADDVSRVIKREYPSTLLVKLISSQMDMDRTDYLLRDSYMTGVQYGRIDLEWLIYSLRVGFLGEEAVIGLDAAKGLSIAESLVLARYNMYLQVYYHKVTRGVEFLIRKIFKRVMDLPCSVTNCDPSIAAILHSASGDVDLPSFLRLDEHSFWFAFRRWADSDDVVLGKLCSMLLERRLFAAEECAEDILSKQMEKLSSARKNAQRCDFLKGVTERDIEYFCGYDDSACVGVYEDLLIAESDKEASKQIFLIDGEGTAQNLSEKSPIINTLRNTKKTLVRLYHPK